MKGYVGSVCDVYDYVYVSSCYREFVRKTLIRVSLIDSGQLLRQLPDCIRDVSPYT